MNPIASFLRAILVVSAAAATACSGGDPVTPAPGKTAEEIIGGVTDSGTGAHPAVVFLTHQGYSCTGTLIAPKLVLTARHCVSTNITQGIGCDIYGASQNGDHVGADYTPSTIQVRTGVSPSFGGSPAAVGAQVFHPPGNNLCNDDIALIVLNQAITSATPQKIRYTYAPQIGELATAVGYGGTSESGNGAGTRRRKPNVPIISVGQDWNELNGANELSAGQGVCPGDSGGPLLSAGEAVLGVASRVSDCNDPTATAKYVRLDAHKALIDQAFAAAGATPLQETGTPTNPPKKAIGDGPCTTGAECVSYLCQKGTGSFCTQFCDATSCPTGLICTDANVMLGGSSVAQKICSPVPSGTACEACRATECVNVITSCYNNPECKTLLACVDACTDDACVNNCIAQHPGGADDYDIVGYCACNSSCATVCSHQCVAPPGGGGGGGVAGGGAGGSAAGGTGGGPVLGGGTGGSAGAGAGPATKPVDTTGTSSGCNLGGRSSSPLALLSSFVLLFLVRRRRA